MLSILHAGILKDQEKCCHQFKNFKPCSQS